MANEQTDYSNQGYFNVTPDNVQKDIVYPTPQDNQQPDIPLHNKTNSQAIANNMNYIYEVIGHLAGLDSNEDLDDVIEKANLPVREDGSITALDSLDISNLTDISDMFQRAYNFNQDISGWDTSNVTDMSNMFEKSSTFDQDLSSWCVSQIASKPNSFDTNSGFEGQTAKQPKWGQPC